MMNFKEAQKILTANARSSGREKIPLDQVDGRILAESVLADRDYPPFNRSSMDGYSIRYKDFEKGCRDFQIAETIYAGQTASGYLDAGQCYKIMTGAPVPADADTVIRREDADEKEGRVHILLAGCRPFMNISRQGEDLRAGEVAVSGNLLCGPPLIGLLASLGRTELLVERLPRVALLTTGNEVKPVDDSIGPVQIRNSNRWLLQSSLKKWGIFPAHYEHIPDDRPVLYNALSKLLGDAHPFDIIILSGGVSAGDADYVPGVLEELKVRKLFHKLAIKPGKPVWCGVGTVSSPTMVFALPGNPFSCLVNFVLLIRPYLYACFGLAVPGPVQLPLKAFKKKKTPLDEFFPVRTVHKTGQFSGLEPVVLNGSGDIRLGMEADGLALHPAGADDLVEGTMISCYYL